MNSEDRKKLNESLTGDTSKLDSSSPFICPETPINFRKALFAYICAAGSIDEQMRCRFFLLGAKDGCSFLNQQGEMQICTATEAFIG